MSQSRHELLYDMLLDIIPSSVLLIDEKLHIVSANRNFLSKIQRDEPSTVGRHLSEVFPSVILENTDIEGHIREVFRTGVPLKGRRMTYRAPGVPTRIYYYSILPLPSHQVMLLMEDITEQVRLSQEVRRVERHLASVVESASDIVLSTDTEGRILTWNTAAETLSGLAAAQVCGRLLSELCRADQQAALRIVFEVMKSGGGSQTIEFHLNTRNGFSILISWVFSAMKDEYGKTVGVVVVGRDLAERRNLENQLRQSQKLAALGVMAGGIAHEIRNPLAVCYSAAEFLSIENIDTGFGQECIRKIQTGIRKASLIIENLLRFARPSADTDMAPVNLHMLIADTVDLISNQAAVQQIRIRMDLSDKPAMVHGVHGLLQQVFMNIFLNSIQAMPEGGVISIDETLSEVGVTLAISDTGHGIPEGDIEKVFDPFHTASPSRKGTGLGLSICYSIIQQHLGSIQVRSTVGQGATVTVKLPLLLGSPPR